MIRRFGRKEGIYSLIPPFIFYAILSFGIFYSIWPYFYYVKGEKLILLGVFAMWRYGWLGTNYCRSFYYYYIRYPRLRRKTLQIPEEDKFPERLFFLIPSFKEEPWVSVETFQSILSNLADVPCKTTLVVATGSDRDDTVISSVYNGHPCRDSVELVFQRQSEGKRIAMGHGLRAIARRFRDEKNSVTIFMDGDSYLEPRTLQRLLPFFAAFPKVGAVTTNESAYINTNNYWYKDWFNLKFGQRHLLFSSHALSWKVLTLTGRFSCFRTSIVVKEDFIKQIENDCITHWMHGKFRFLMGDDKSSWYYLLKNRWQMLYLPDINCYSLESRDASFLSLSVSLPYRWYGNTMRNNGRALALGWRCTGLFTWIAILDQRLSMWTALVGISGALVLAVTQSFIYLPFFIAWVIAVRILQMCVIAFRGHPVSMLTIPLMLYNQWVGAFVKIRAFFYLSDQKWSKGGQTQDSADTVHSVKHPLARHMPLPMMLMSYAVFAFAIVCSQGVLTFPDFGYLMASPNRTIINAADHGVVANDGKDDGAALQELLDDLSPGRYIIQMPSGTLDFYYPVRITKDDIILQGAAHTRVVSHLTCDAAAIFTIQGSLDPQKGHLQRDLSPQSTQFEFSSRERYWPGNLLLLKVANDEQFFDEIGSEKWRREFPYLRYAIVRVLSVDGEQVTIEAPTGVSFPADKTTVQKIRPVRNCILQDFSMEQLVQEGSGGEDVQLRYENVYPQYMVDGVAMKWAESCSLRHLRIVNAGRHPVSLDSVYDTQLTGLDIEGAWNKGKGGSGYVRFARTFYSSLRDSTVKGIRHITLQWSSAFNLVSNVQSSVDINFHGGYSHDNRVQNISFTLPEGHKWPRVYRTGKDARWAPPDGENNVFVE
jgi:glycosyltransferase Alg8